MFTFSMFTSQLSVYDVFIYKFFHHLLAVTKIVLQFIRCILSFSISLHILYITLFLFQMLCFVLFTVYTYITTTNKYLFVYLFLPLLSVSFVVSSHSIRVYQCDQKKSPNVYKSCPKMISLEK